MIDLSNNKCEQLYNPFTLDRKIKELKRLQKEIDEAEEKRTTIICSNWGFGKQGNDDEEHQILMDIIESNQLKIKQIIESL